MTYRCLKCGQTGIDARGRNGHAKFSGGDHGDRQELPDDYSKADWFEKDDEANEEADADEGDEEDDPDPSEQEESDSDESEASESNEGDGTLDLIKTALFDDASVLVRGFDGP